MNNKLSIKAVGDIDPGNYSLDGLGICSLTKKHGCDYPFKNLGNLLKDTDLLIGNLEGTLSQKTLTQSLRHCGLPDMAGVLKGIGFDVLSVANNHILDHGVDVFKETIEYCTEVGIKICGLRGKGEYYSEPVILEKNSLTIGILAYNWVGIEDANAENSQYIANINDGVVNYTWNRDKEKDIKSRDNLHEKNKEVISDISKLRSKVDIVILMPHWGYEWSNYPPYGVILEAHAFIDAGVDLIVGSHPHVIQGIEKYGNGHIAYSLGNFLFDFATDKYVSGMMLETNIVDGMLEDYKPRIIVWNKKYQLEGAKGSVNQRYIDIVERSTQAILSDDIEQKLDDELIYKEYEKNYNYTKFLKILFLFRKLLTHPYLIKPVFKKIQTLIEVIILRIKGKRVRW